MSLLDQTHSGVPVDILVDLATALCPRAPVAEPQSVDGIIGRCPGEGRRAELHEIVRRIDSLPAAERLAIVESVDDIQMRSKLWLIDELARAVDLAATDMVVLGAWYGMLPLLFNLRLERPPASMLCVDINAHPCRIGESVIGALYSNVRYRCTDAMDFDYRAAGTDTVVVNTICEHLADVSGWWRLIPDGQLVVLQSNDYFPCPDHVNCVRGLVEMKEQTPFRQILFEGVLPLSLFNRFMVIGYR
jgi:hypothetical protein